MMDMESTTTAARLDLGKSPQIYPISCHDLPVTGPGAQARGLAVERWPADAAYAHQCMFVHHSRQCARARKGASLQGLHGDLTFAAKLAVRCFEMQHCMSLECFLHTHLIRVICPSACQHTLILLCIRLTYCHLSSRQNLMHCNMHGGTAAAASA